MAERTAVKKNVQEIAMQGAAKAAEKQGKMAAVSIGYTGNAMGFEEQDLLDDDWNQLYQLAMAAGSITASGKEQTFSYTKQDGRKQSFKVYPNEKVAGEPLELFPGAAVDLSPLKGSVEKAGFLKKKLTGQGGLLVLAPPGSENAVPAILSSIELHSEGDVAARAVKGGGVQPVPGTGAERKTTFTFHEPGKRYISAKELKIGKNSVQLLDAVQYAEAAGRMEKVEGAEITGQGISDGMASPMPQPARPSPERMTPETEPAAASESREISELPDILEMPTEPERIKAQPYPVRNSFISIAGRDSRQTYGIITAQNFLPEEEFVQEDGTTLYRDTPVTLTLFGSRMYTGQGMIRGIHSKSDLLEADSLTIPLEALEMDMIFSDLIYSMQDGSWVASSRVLQKMEKEGEEDEEGELLTDEQKDKLLDIIKEPETAVQQLKELAAAAAQEKRENLFNQLSMAYTALSMTKAGEDKEAIGEALKEMGYEEEEEDEKEGSKLGIEWSMPLFEYPIIPPLLSFGLEFKAEGRLEKFFQKPAFSKDIELGAGVRGAASVALSATVDAGVPYVFGASARLSAKAEVAGSGDKNEILGGTLKAPIEYSENNLLQFADNPELTLRGGVDLKAILEAGLSVGSKLFSWEKELWSYQIGEWNLASLEGELTFRKQDRDLIHPFRNWKFKNSNITGQAFGKTFLSRNNEQNQYGITIEDSQKVLEGTIREKEKFMAALDALRKIKESGSKLLKTSGQKQGDSQFSGLVRHAEELEEKFQAACEVNSAQITLILRDIEAYIGTDTYKKNRELFVKRQKKHEKQWRVLQGEEGSEDQVQKLQSNIRRSKGFRKNLSIQAMQKLFAEGSAKAYEEQQRDEIAKESSKRLQKLQTLMDAYQMDEQSPFNQALAEAYWEQVLKGMNMREVARIYGKKNDFLQYEEGRKQFYTAEDAKERQKEIKSASSSFWESDFQENMDKPDGKLKINYAAKRGGDYRWIAVGGIDRILAFETKKVDMMRRGENGTPKVAESSQNFQQKKQLQALPTEIPAEQRYLSASVDELIAWQEARAQAAAQQETAFKQWIETLQMDSAGNKRPMQFRENIKPFLTLEILKDYETKRLAELKAEQSLGKDGQSGKKSLAYRIAWHLRRIETIEAGIKVRNGQSDENEKKQVEAREIEKYFKATGTDRTAEGMLSALKEGRFQNREIEERGRKGYTEYLNQQNAGLQYLYGAKTDTAASNAELINYYFRHFGEEEDKENLNQFLGGLRQNQEEGVQKENLKRYQEAKLAEQTRDDGMEYSHWEILERLKKMPRDPLEAVISAYISMGGGKEYVESDFFQVTPRALLEFEETHTHGEGWYKHNERTTKIMKERSKGLEAVANQYESMVDSSARTIFGENFYKAAILKSYVLPHLTPGFIKKREERFCAASTKDIDDRLAIISRGTAGRTPEGSDENVLLEEQQKAFKEYIDTGTRFGKRRWDWLGADSMVREKIKELAEDENYSGSAALIDYEKEKADEYKRKTENLDKPVRVLNEAIDQLTEMIGTSQEAIDDLEKIQRDPRGFFTAQDLTDNILTDVGKQYDTLEEAVNTQKPLPDSLQRNIDNLVITDEIPEIDPDQLLGL